MSAPLEGGCFCKSVRYRLHGAPIVVHCCHCLNCQSQTGSAFVLNAIIETTLVEQLSGALTVSELEAGDGSPHDIYRCAKCQVAVWSDYGRRPFRFVRVGTLDDPATLPPEVHIYTRSKQPWVELPEEIPSFEVYYDPQKLLSSESWARRCRALDQA